MLLSLGVLMMPLHRYPTVLARAQDGPRRGNRAPLNKWNRRPVRSIRRRFHQFESAREGRALNGRGREERLLLRLLVLLVLLVLRRLRRGGRLSCRGVWVHGISNELRGVRVQI